VLLVDSCTLPACGHCTMLAVVRIGTIRRPP
jgi:hypothetical protein